MKNFIILPAFLILLGCNNDSSSSDVAVEGFDLSGNYRLAGVECYNSAGTALTASALLDPGYTSNVAISGNSLITQSAGGVGGCTARETRRVVFTESTSVLTLSNASLTTSTGTPCTFNYSFTNSTGAITPTTFSSTSDPESPGADITTNALRNTTTGAIGVLSIIQSVSSSTDICLLVLMKL